MIAAELHCRTGRCYGLDLSEPEANNNHSHWAYMIMKKRCIARFPCNSTALVTFCCVERSILCYMTRCLSTCMSLV